MLYSMYPYTYSHYSISSNQATYVLFSFYWLLFCSTHTIVALNKILTWFSYTHIPIVIRTYNNSVIHMHIKDISGFTLTKSLIYMQST